MQHPARAIAHDLAGQAERFCRRYLSNGRREGSYWLVGDVRNTPGRSLYVRLRDSPDGTARAGKWTDAGTGEHGDLLDILRSTMPTGRLSEALVEARRFLAVAEPHSPAPVLTGPKALVGSPDAARRLLALTCSIGGTIAEAYLASRGIAGLPNLGSLRFHQRCWYRPARCDPVGTPRAMPAMIAAVTDLAGTVTGAHRTWLAPDGAGKAPVVHSRRAMGHLLGNGVRFGAASPVMAAGEGIETILSLVCAVPTMRSVAALSAAHLGALAFPPGLRRLYVAREPDAAGRHAFARLAARATMSGIEVLPIDCARADLNADLTAFGLDALRERIRAQLVADDRP